MVRCISVAESVHYPWERTLTDPNKVPYYVKYVHVLYFRQRSALYNLNYILCYSLRIPIYFSVLIEYIFLHFLFADLQPWNRTDTVGSSRNGWNSALLVWVNFVKFLIFAARLFVHRIIKFCAGFLSITSVVQLNTMSNVHCLTYSFGKKSLSLSFLNILQYVSCIQNATFRV